MSTRSKNYIDKFWSKVSIGRKDDCWRWLAHIGKDGYGVFSVYSKLLKAHRFSWLITNTEKDIPEGLCICHKCDNRFCVNPNHLFLGTYVDNMQDMIKKGRQSVGMCHGKKLRGEKNGKVKLTQIQVDEMRKIAKTEKITQHELAEMYNISETQVSNILSGKRWNKYYRRPLWRKK